MPSTSQFQCQSIPTVESLKGQRFALATRHGKEWAFAPAFETVFGAEIVVAAIDTDALGTFDGDVPRPMDAVSVVIEKARRGATALGLRYGLASEGTFGPHPMLPILPITTEHVAFVDLKSGHSVVETLSNHSTNFSHLDPGGDLEAFLARIGFPHHAVLARNVATGAFEKGLNTRPDLEAAFERLGGMATVRLETDMRAHVNPTRMIQIAIAADRLAYRLSMPCPVCAAPGFGSSDVLRGLPCIECGSPTDLVRAEVCSCSACGTKQEVPRRDGRTHADAVDCPVCNS